MKALKKQIQEQGLGLALSGGSVRGFFHIGVLQALEEYEIPISYIAGISIGSLIGGLYSYGYKAQDILIFLSDHAEFKTLLNSASFSIFNKKGLFSGNVMIKEINTLVKNTPIENLKIPFVCRAVDLHYFQEVIFESGNLGKAIKASCAIPGVFTPEESQKHEMIVDGSILGAIPLTVLKERFNGPVLASNLISYNNISASQAERIQQSFNQNIIHKVLPFTDPILRSFYMMQSYISTLELEKFKPDLYVEFNETYYPNITNILAIKNQLVHDGYYETKKLLKNLNF